MLKYLAILFAFLFAFSMLATPSMAAQSSAKRVVKQTTIAKVKPYRATLKRSKRFENAANSITTNQTQKWECTETDKGFGGCVCKGMLDCKSLIDSGKCKGKSIWEDSNDPSVGGCD